jgi:hypothetical protein
MCTRHIWRAVPSLNAGLEGSRSVCCRAFTCAEEISVHPEQPQSWQSKAKVCRRSMTHGLERVGEELGDDPAAGAGEPVDQRVRHPRAGSSCLPVPLLDAPPADGPPHRAHDASAVSQETEARRGRHGTTGTTASSVSSVLLH